MKNRIVLLFVALFISPVIFAQHYSFEKIPLWVKGVELPQKSDVSKNDIALGYYLTLYDCQVNLEKNEVFNREVRNVFSYSGITNASQLMVSYDTSYQKLKIHHLYVWRKGQKIDRTSSLNFRKMNNEYYLNQGLYLGKIIEYDILDDIRKDDMIDFAYTLVGNNPIFENEKYLFIPLESNNYIDLYTFRAIFPKDKEYTYKCMDCDSLNYSDSIVDGYRQIAIDTKNLKAVNYENSMPTWIIPYKYFSLTSFKSWSDVNKWAQNVFALGKEPNLDVVYKEIFTGNETTEEKINKIINYVQDDIRYMGVESGIGSIKPFAPEEVAKRRYGDCKDKSLLLVSLLKQVGVTKAYPALVNTYMRSEVDKFYPSNQVFNHCIATFEYNDSTYWVDPTITLQGGDFKSMYHDDYGKALVIGMSSDSLQSMIPSRIPTEVDIVEELTAKSFTEPATLKITASRIGSEADDRRVLLENYAANDLSKMVMDDLKSIYPTVNKSSDMEVADDIGKNNIAVTYSYTVDGFWKDGDESEDGSAKGYWIFRFEPLSLYPCFGMFASEERKFDLALTYPQNFKYHVIFHLPKDVLISDDYKSFESKAFFYDEKIEQLSSKSFQVDYTFRVKTKVITPSEYKEVYDQKTKIMKGLPIVIYFLKN